MADACRQSHGYLRRALSAEVITPGTTTTADVEWWLRDAVHGDGHGSWFQPTCTVQRRGGAARDSFAGKEAETVIEAGDLVHVDFGIVADGYHTDQQQHAYVLATGRDAGPGGLVAGMARANRLQDLLMAQFTAGRTGNEILRGALEAATAEALDGLIYTPPDRPPRPRRRSDDRPVGQPGRRRGPGRLPGVAVHGVLDRAAGPGRRRGVGRPGRPVHARGGRLVRRRRLLVPRRPPDGALADLTAGP